MKKKIKGRRGLKTHFREGKTNFFEENQDANFLDSVFPKNHGGGTRRISSGSGNLKERAGTNVAPLHPFVFEPASASKL